RSDNLFRRNSMQSLPPFWLPSTALKGLSAFVRGSLSNGRNAPTRVNRGLIRRVGYSDRRRSTGLRDAGADARLPSVHSACDQHQGIRSGTAFRSAHSAPGAVLGFPKPTSITYALSVVSQSGVQPTHIASRK